MPLHWLLSILGIIFAVTYGLIIWQRARIASAYEFLGDVKVELRKVNWPNRREIVNTTSVVLVTVFFFGAYLQLVDVVVSYARRLLFSAVGLGG